MSNMEIYQSNRQTHSFNKSPPVSFQENIRSQSAKEVNVSITARPIPDRLKSHGSTVYSDLYSMRDYKNIIKNFDKYLEVIVVSENPKNKTVRVIDPVENVVKFIENSHLASFKNSQRDKIKSLFNQMHENNGYNVFKLVDLLNEIYRVAGEDYGQKKNVKIEFDYYIDNEEPDLNGLSINIFLPTENAEILSNIWEHLNEKLVVEDFLSDKIFFNVKQRILDAT